MQRVTYRCWAVPDEGLGGAFQSFIRQRLQSACHMRVMLASEALVKGTY